MNSQRSFYELVIVLLELACQGNHFSYCQELFVCLLVAESVKALCGKEITPYRLNKAFLVKSVNQNPRNHHKEAHGTLSLVHE